jgi:hypothetical protein
MYGKSRDCHSSHCNCINTNVLTSRLAYLRQTSMTKCHNEICSSW